MASTKRQQKIPKIAGYPVWKLHGVNAGNAKIVRETGFWIHYGRFGDDGWGIAAPDSFRKSLLAELRKHGIKAAPWAALPKRSPVGICTMLGIWALCLILEITSSPLSDWILPMVVASIFLWLILGSLIGRGLVRRGKHLQAPRNSGQMYDDNGQTGYMGFPVNRD